ncbi:Putative teichuronic acid biosynthesis glycosyltransferase TuaC [Lacunisphaera limnophila]|uniref:Teichuronic acid biosynthesis glycosyltransferase TuaC n=1 Tax=Lacunisphaera limnophila TaxID=1838286 RepID=A0A1D8AVN5_9BACT|nr:glycosyltransferase [Lacunisphaera limnophila]AOS44960.1 Putative teichuronic acid biosynthesis glycosyltransferase TuaC [Lacunisphaera limnophila]
MNENDSYIFDVELPVDWTFAGEPTWISGWFLSKTSAYFSDIRAVTGGAVHLGILGIPRPEVEERHRGHAGLPHAGFVLQVRPPLGAKDLRLELLDAGGRWVEIWRTGIRVKQGPAPGGRLNAGIVPDQLRKLLQARRADPAADLAPRARRLARESAVIPLDSLPNPPFFGALEKPLLTGGSQFGKVSVEGWIIHREQRIRRLVASTHPLVEVEMDYGDRERLDAGEMFPGHPYARHSQYFGMVDIDEQADDPACLKVFADLEDGTRHLVFVRRFYQRGCTQEERPLPEFSRATFLETALAFASACRAEDIRLGRLSDYWRQCGVAYRLYRQFAPTSLAHLQAGPIEPYLAWQRAHALTPRLRSLLESAATPATPDHPRFTVLVDPRGCTPAQLARLGASLTAQIYPHWQACFVGAPAPAGDSRILSQTAAQPADFIRACNTAAHAAKGTHLTLLPGHARLSPDALGEIAGALTATPELELVYTDEDRMDDAGRRSSPVFKPAWSPALADSGLFPGHLTVVRQDRFLELGSFREDYPLRPWFDLLLRLTDRLEAARVAHVPLVCAHADAGIPEQTPPSDPTVEEARRALADAARRRGRATAPFLPEAGHHRQVRFHQFRPEPGILARLPVTIVIPTRDRLHLLQECVELLEETVDWRHVKLVIVDDHSRDADAVRYLELIQQRTDLRCVVVRPADRAAPFNYSHLVNLAGPHLDTPLVLHLNNDVNALEPGWLEEMATWFLQPDIGVVGAKLIYPDRTLNHTGIIIGPHGGLADTPFAKLPPAEVPVVWHEAAREVSAVTGACLLTRTDLYRELGGFDEPDFGVAYNDVDYCLRVRAAGRRVIYTPQAKLMHWGSATRGVTFDDREHIAFVRRYPQFADPYLSPHLTLAGNRLVCTPATPVRAGRAGKLRLLLLTHNLNLEGAPLFLLEYATWMVCEAGFTLEVLASQDGPLRAAYEALGAHITVVDAAPLYASPDEETFHQRLGDIKHRLDWDHIDLVVCNTLVSFWGVLLAARAGKPSLFYIHESSTVFRFFERKLELSLHRLVAEAFHGATRALFLCDATRAYYEDHNVSGNFRIVPSWINLDDIDTFRAAHTRAAMRRKHGFADDETIIANIGTVCERKGQHVFLRAIEHFNRQGHRGKFRFVLVGARPGIYLDLLKRDIARMGLPNLTLIPETREVFDFFVAADQFVCTSYEESFPRVVMEAMAFRTPIVTTDVHGIAEMIGQRQHGYLVSAGDHLGLSRMMWTCLAKERSGKSLTPTAYSKALRTYDHRKVLPFHVALAREACLAHP